VVETDTLVGCRERDMSALVGIIDHMIWMAGSVGL